MVYQQSKYDKYTCLVSYQMAAVYQGIGIHWKLFASHVSDQQVCQGNSNKRHAALASTFFCAAEEKNAFCGWTVNNCLQVSRKI